MKENSQLRLSTLIFLIFVPTFGFGNITNNVVALGAASIPCWFLVSLCFFLPLSLFIAELASRPGAGSAGIYSWIAGSMGHTWAFVGTWSYFVSNLFYLQLIFARVPVMVSWAVWGRNVFSDASTYLLPVISILLMVALTWIASRGVGFFSHLSDIGGKLTLAATVLFILFALLGWALGQEPQTQLTAATMTPNFNADFFATFSWLLLAVAGAEVGGTYFNKVKNPRRNFTRGVLLGTLLVGGAYTLGSLAVLLTAGPETLANAGIKDANYLVYQLLAERWGLNGTLVARLYGAVLALTSVAAYVVWLESPLRALFSEVPAGVFPPLLTRKTANGSLRSALWLQCGILAVMMAAPLLKIGAIDDFFNLLTDLSALSSVPAYVLLAIAYLVFRLKNPPAPFTAFPRNRSAVPIALLVIGLGLLGFVGAGLSYLMDGGRLSLELGQTLKIYGGPLLLIALGVLLRTAYQKKHQTN